MAFQSGLFQDALRDTQTTPLGRTRITKIQLGGASDHNGELLQLRPGVSVPYVLSP